MGMCQQVWEVGAIILNKGARTENVHFNWEEEGVCVCVCV